MRRGTNASEPILSLEGVAKSFGGLRAVDDASFAVAAGSITALIGPNGGKTTVFDLISGYERPDSGAVIFEGRRIDSLATHRIARRGLVRTFQLTRTFASALMTEPKLVLLDEPMAGVNRALGASLLDEAERHRREEGVAFLFIEHDIDIVMRRADHVIAMAEGAVIAEGPPGLIRRDPRLIDAYLGRRGVVA